MNKLSINACPLCGGTHLKRVMTCTDYYASGEQFDVLSCEAVSYTHLDVYKRQVVIVGGQGDTVSKETQVHSDIILVCFFPPQ